MSAHRGGEGLPTPSRRTFVSALLASTLCMSAALRHRGFACSHSPFEGIDRVARRGGIDSQSHAAERFAQVENLCYEKNG